MLRVLFFLLSLNLIPLASPLYRVTDAFGVVFSFKSSPKRVVSLAPAVTEMLSLLGCRKEIIGVSTYDEFEAVKVGGIIDPNFELLLSLKPDLIFVMQPTPMRTIQMLKQKGLPVFAVGEPRSLKEVVYNLTLLGRIMGRKEKAQQLAESFLKELEKKVAKVNLRVYIGGLKPPYWTGGKGTYISDLIEKAGAVNCADGLRGWLTLSGEKLLELNPQVLVIPEGKYMGSKQEILGYLKKSFPWKHVDAVKRNRFLFIDENLIFRPGSALFKALKKLREYFASERLH